MNPAHSHAIVVGIEKYDIGDSWDLNGPAVDAARFIRWLRSRGVPAANIRLFAAPLERNKGELASLDVQARPADSKTVIDALGDFAGRSGELLFLFWGGHGVSGEDSRRLFYSDVAPNLLRNSQFPAVLRFFRSLSGFSRQVFFVDTCANYFELMQSPVALADVELPSGLPAGSVSQYVLFGAGAGEYAANDSVLRTGAFSSCLLEGLEVSPTTEWPPSLPDVQSQLEASMLRLRAEGRAEQTPVTYNYRDWAGHEGTLRDVAAVVPPAAAGVLSPAHRDLLPRFELTSTQTDELTGALLDCQPMQSAAGRQVILGDLRVDFADVVDGIPHAADNRTHTRNIATGFSRSGEWTSLIKRVLFHERNTLAGKRLSLLGLELDQRLFNAQHLKRLRGLIGNIEANVDGQFLRHFHDCAEDLDIPELKGTEGPYPLLLMLAGFPSQPTGFPIRALQFAQILAPLLPANAGSGLQEIVQQVAGNEGLSDELQLLRNSPTSEGAKEITLVFEMKAKGDGFVLSASRLDAAGRWTSLPTDDHPVSEDDAKTKFRELVANVEQHSMDLVIEMALSREMLCSPVDRWKIAVGKYPIAVGAQYPVVLRWLDRLRDKALEPRWVKKWQSVKSHPGQPLWLTRTDEFKPSQLLAKLGEAPATGAFISFAFTPSSAVDVQQDTLAVALDGGTPVAVWWRECDPDPVKAQQELQTLLQLKRLVDLPAVLKAIRNKAEQVDDPKHPGCRIALLFDNPDHRPPSLRAQR